MRFCIAFLGFLMYFLNSSIVFLIGFLNVIVHENS